MAEIKDAHVEWRVVHRLRELLDHPPAAEHDITLTYALFTSLICWTVQRLRETKTKGPHEDIWSALGKEMAVEPPWHWAQLEPRKIRDGASDIATLPASWLLVGLRNGIAHGDHRNVVPYHVRTEGADHELKGFWITASFTSSKEAGKRDWGDWTMLLTRKEMRRIGLLVADGFVDVLSKDGQGDALRHVKTEAA